MFENRRDAGRRLALMLLEWRGRDDVIVLGIPRGGVVVAAEVARRLNAPLDVFIAHKIGAPGNPELAIGAVAGDGSMVLDEDDVADYGIPPDYIERERQAQLREIDRRARKYRPGRPARPVEGRVVIVCDDGIATGATARAALRALRQQRPARLILAVPVAPRATVERIGRECDAVTVVDLSEPFFAVGRFYSQFEQTSDEEVIAALAEAGNRAGNAP